MAVTEYQKKALIASLDSEAYDLTKENNEGSVRVCVSALRTRTFCCSSCVSLSRHRSSSTLSTPRRSWESLGADLAQQEAETAMHGPLVGHSCGLRRGA